MISKGISAGDVKEQVDNSKAGYYHVFIPYLSNESTTGSGVTVYKKTVDVTYIDYLMVNYTTDAPIEFDLEVGGVNKIGNSHAGNTNSFNKVDLTSETGDQIIEIILESSQADKGITNLMMYNMES